MSTCMRFKVPNRSGPLKKKYLYVSKFVDNDLLKRNGQIRLFIF